MLAEALTPRSANTHISSHLRKFLLPLFYAKSQLSSEHSSSERPLQVVKLDLLIPLELYSQEVTLFPRSLPGTALPSEHGHGSFEDRAFSACHLFPSSLFSSTDILAHSLALHPIPGIFPGDFKPMWDFHLISWGFIP